MIWHFALVLSFALAACAAPAQSQPASSQEGGVPTLTENQPTQAIPVTAPIESLTVEAPTEAATQAPIEPSSTFTPPAPKAPTPTSTTAPVSNGSDNGNFSLSGSNTAPASDVISEFAVSVEGKDEGSCFDLGSDVFLNNTDRELMEGTFVAICGWQSGEKVAFTVTRPDGKSDTKELTAQDVNGNNQVKGRFQPRVTDPEGTYQFEMKGDSGTVQYQMSYHKPSGPRLYIVSKDRFKPLIDTKENSYNLEFYGFQPGEKVRLVAYKTTGSNGATDNMSAAGWQDYTMDGKGRLTIGSKEKGLAYLAVGRKSGEAHLFTLKPSDGGLWDWFGAGKDFYCANALPSQVRGEFSLKVLDVSANGVVMRDQPGKDGNEVVTVANGSAVQINQGPKCADGAFWWNVFEPGGNSGWMPESIGDQYVMVPIQN